MRQLKPTPRPKLLDLFCGAGGAARGYVDAGWECVGVDYARQDNYPYEFHQLDVMTLDLAQLVAWEGFQAIHASPPCQSYSMATSHLASWDRPKLIEPLRERLMCDVPPEIPWVIENVNGAPLYPDKSITLCGTMFRKKIWRHRIFESNVPLTIHCLECDHSLPAVNVHAAASRNAETMAEWMNEMEIDKRWMTQNEALQSVPPYFTEYIGLQIKESSIERRVAI